MEQDQEHPAFHPSQLEPGTHIIFVPDMTEFTLRERKENDAGWWLDSDAAGATPGVDDNVWMLTDQWAVVDETLDDDEIAAIAIDVDSLDPGDLASMAQLMHESNESRVAALEAQAGPGNQGSLENAFDALRMLVFLEQIALKLDISDQCNLDFEGRRAQMLTNIEHKYAEMLAAREMAERQARLAGGPVGNRGGQRMAPGPGGKLRPIG